MSSATADGGVVAVEGDITAQVEVGGAQYRSADPGRASMHADLDLLLTDCLLHR